MSNQNVLILATVKAPRLMHAAEKCADSFWCLHPLRSFMISLLACFLAGVITYLILDALSSFYKFWITHEIIARKDIWALRKELFDAKAEVKSLTTTNDWYAKETYKLHEELRILSSELAKAKAPAKSVVADVVNDIVKGFL